MGQNLVEKIAQEHISGTKVKVKAGDYITISPSYVMTHDNSGAVIPKFKSIGASKIYDPRQLVFTLDHNVQDKSEANLKKYSAIKEFAAQNDIDFYPAGRGIGHQIMCEEGYAWPQTMVVASDSHSNMYGGLGCLGTPIVRTDAASIWATGKTWWQVPQVARCELKGKLSQGVFGKDVIVTLCGFFNNDEVLNHAVEFCGEGVAGLSIDDRLTIANMTTEWGALVGLFPVDEGTIAWLEKRINFIEQRGAEGVPSDSDNQKSHPRMSEEKLNILKNSILSADDDCFYSRKLTLDLSTVSPHVSGPNSVKIMTSVRDLREKKIAVQKAYLVSCVNSRIDDLAAAASVVDGKKVADGVEFYIAAASSEVQKESEKRGDWQKLITSGARVLPPGCGPCIGLGEGLLQAGEVGISATNRNFKGRMGSRDAFAYLASPSVVAASAISGFIDMPHNFSETEILGNMEISKRDDQKQSETELIDGFQKTYSGRLLYCQADNMNTDGIFPGKYTYLDNFTAEQQAKAAMENYDPKFQGIAQGGDILVGGYNFGTGSSREQAATALKYKGIQLIVAASFSETYKRNAINNGFVTIECPELVDTLKTEFSDDTLTRVGDGDIIVDFEKAEIEYNNRQYQIRPLGKAAQELIVLGGLEKWVQANISKINK